MLSPSLPISVVVATAIGLSLNIHFISGSLALTNIAIPAILLPDDAPLMPPLAFVHKRRAQHFRGKFENAAKATDTPQIEGKAAKPDQSPSTTNYILRQWFHVFAKGMGTYPPAALLATISYLYCFFALPGPFYVAEDSVGMVRRALYSTAALLSIGSQIFTLTVMKPVNARINARVEEVCEKESLWAKVEERQEKKGETVEMIREWGLMNARRVMLPLVAGVCAVGALAMPVRL